jgi:hypothetical protein
MNRCSASKTFPTRIPCGDGDGRIVPIRWSWEGDESDGNTCPETITRTYRATDDCGNTAECTQTIVVDDTIPPVITCPSDVTVQCIEDVPDPNIGDVTASDNCDDDVTITWEGDESDGNTCPEIITPPIAQRMTAATAECTQPIVVIHDSAVTRALPT